jgi:hypothetical protein
MTFVKIYQLPQGANQMTIILDQYAMPETGTFEIHRVVNIQISAKQAQRKVDTWLLNEVSTMMGAEAPTLVIGARTVWRVPCRFTAPSVGRVGTVGEVDVDAQTGEMYNVRDAKAAIIRCARVLAKKLPPFRVREVPPEYLATNVPPAPLLIINEDGYVVPSPSADIA